MNSLKLFGDQTFFAGHCQVTYITVNKMNEKIVYCLQQDGKDTMKLMRCSRDGEPSHEVTPKNRLTFERPDRNTRLNKLANKWIDEHERNFENVTV